MSSSSNDTITTKCNKRKIEIKKVEPNNKRHVTFTKRKLGLFNKVTELSILCQAETAVILSSQQGKLYTCGYPDPDAVIRRFLTDGSPVQRGRAGKKQQQELVETLRLEYEDTHKMLQEEKKKLDEIKEAHNGRLDFPAWWNKDIEKMGVEDLENFMASLEILKLNLVATAEGMKLNSRTPMIPTPIDPRAMFSNTTATDPRAMFSNFNGCFSGNHQAWNSMNGSSSSSRNPLVTKFDLGHY
ncbi:hypothetical protein TanjilG_13922 [Lupinus angustifolius]|uniref:MADS-box domain-containing protein n=1 Tax=Lupinus angustifolius TaxID=3871 RepID=A0A1J7GVY3_LUPAN|nr:PREDICTED: agamous-like MADS-box protein AGL62 [Lupinus angustifolius]OIW04540.1 hypothetical protein TanjilG_13922 [Lupinus angustifolius]